MRQLAFFLLLATAAAPALAAPGEDGGPRRHRGEASEQSDSRPERAARRSESGEQRAPDAQRPERSQPNAQGSFERMRQHFQEQQAQREQRHDNAETQLNSVERVRNWRRGQQSGDEVQTQSSWQPRERRIRTIPDTQPNVTTQSGSQVARAYDGHRRRDYRDGNYTRWSSSNWRNDHRYDWYRWRDRHRSLFRLGFYYDPFGWSYRRWSIGSFLYPSYYGSSYWLDDPWDYRLPPAYGPYRWVRYWDDALLVNIYTGQVVDVIHNFFW